MGLLIAVELEDGLPAATVTGRALDLGLVINAVTPTALRLAPSLLVTHSEIDEAIDILGRAIRESAAAAQATAAGSS